MAKQILTYEGIGPDLNEATNLLREWPELVVLDKLGDNLVVEGPAPSLKSARAKLHGWRFAPVRTISHPENRVRVKQPKRI